MQAVAVLLVGSKLEGRFVNMAVFKVIVDTHHRAVAIPHGIAKERIAVILHRKGGTGCVSLYRNSDSNVKIAQGFVYFEVTAAFPHRRVRDCNGSGGETV